MMTKRGDRMWVRRWIGWVVVTLWLSGCAVIFNLGTTPHTMEEAWDDGIYDEGLYGPTLYHDGVYTGRQQLPTLQFIVVDIAIKHGRMVAIHLRTHPAWRAPREQENLIQTVLSYQTTAIGPREEGSEQDHLLDAIDKALNQARQKPAVVN